MTFSPAFLDDIRARLRLAEIVGAKVKLQRRGREFIGFCPFHREKTPSFTVVEDKGFFHCFGCGAHGSAFDFLMRTENLTFPEAVERLAAMAGLAMPRRDPGEDERARHLAGLHDVLEEACLWFERRLAAGDGAPARAWLRQRGIAAETARRFRLGYAPDGRRGLSGHLAARGATPALLAEAGLVVGDGEAVDRFRHRLIFPIGDARGRVVGFAGRALGDHPAKYLNSPEGPLFHKGRLLYGLAQARRPAVEAGTVIVVEGYMDVLALAQAGLCHVVAPMGTALTEAQLALLWRLADEPVLCFDGDDAGRRAALRVLDRALPALAPGKSLNFVRLGDGLDPDDLIRARGRAGLEAALAHKIALIDMLWRSAVENGRFDTPERRAGLERDLMAQTGHIGEVTVQRRYRDALKERLWHAFGGGGRRRADGAWPERRRAAAVLEPRPSPPRGGDGREEVERLLLELPLDHDGLLEQVAERLAELDFATPGAARLRDLMLDALAGEEGLDSAALQRHLEAGDRGDRGDRRTLPLWFARRPPGGAVGAVGRADMSGGAERAARRWQHAFDLHRRHALEDEIKAGAAAWPQDADEEGWRRLRAMLALLEDSQAKGREAATRETGEA